MHTRKTILTFIFGSILLIVGGCATTETKRDELVSVRELFDSLTSSDNAEELFPEDTGLTPKGCAIIFLDDSATCLSNWSGLSYEERVKRLYAEGSPLVRGLLQFVRAQSIELSIMESAPDISSQELAELLGIIFSPEMEDECLTQTDSHPDFCLFTFRELATPEEAMDAVFTLQRLEAEKEDLRQAIQDVQLNRRRIQPIHVRTMR